MIYNSFTFLHSFSLRSLSSCVYRTVFYQSRLISSHSSVRLSRCDPAIDHLTKWLKLISRQMLFIAHMCECVCASVSTCGAFGLGNCRCTLSLSLGQWCCPRFSQTHAVTAITSYENEAGVAALFGLTIADRCWAASNSDSTQCGAGPGEQQQQIELIDRSRKQYEKRR